MRKSTYFHWYCLLVYRGKKRIKRKQHAYDRRNWQVVQPGRSFLSIPSEIQALTRSPARALIRVNARISNRSQELNRSPVKALIHFNSRNTTRPVTFWWLFLEGDYIPHEYVSTTAASAITDTRVPPQALQVAALWSWNERKALDEKKASKLND